MKSPSKNKKTEDSFKELVSQSAKTYDERFYDLLLKLGMVANEEKMFFVQHLSIMFRAGIPILAALRTLVKQSESKTFAYGLKQMSYKIEQGSSLAESLKLYPKIFDELFINMIESGEVSGKLEDVLKNLYVQMKKQHELTSRVKGALTYPVILVTAMVGIVIFMMIFVIPKMTSIFKEMSVEVPLATRILITVSDFMGAHWILSISSIIIVVLAIFQILQTKKGKYLFQAGLLSFPIIGPIVKKINLARFSRTVSSLLKTDIMIVNAFQITASVLGNLHYRKVVLEISEKLKKGGQINEVIKNYPKFFPPMVTQMVIIGEQTGEISSILDEVASFYEDEIDQIMQNLPSIIEPLLILGLGVGIGGIAIAVVMPMYSLTSAI
jgi:type IV pilus assembly protein PilC